MVAIQSYSHHCRSVPIFAVRDALRKQDNSTQYGSHGFSGHFLIEFDHLETGFHGYF